LENYEGKRPYPGHRFCRETEKKTYWIPRKPTLTKKEQGSDLLITLRKKLACPPGKPEAYFRERGGRFVGENGETGCPHRPSQEGAQTPQKMGRPAWSEGESTGRRGGNNGDVATAKVLPGRDPERGI